MLLLLLLLVVVVIVGDPRNLPLKFGWDIADILFV